MRLRALEARCPGPLWQQIVDQLTVAILTGKAEPGQKLPSQHELAGIFRVSREPIKTAMRVLIRAGMVETVPGGGAFVAMTLPRPNSPADAIADRLAAAYTTAKSGRTPAARDYAFVLAGALADCLGIVSGRDQAWWLNRCETLYRAGEELTGPLLLAGNSSTEPEHLTDLVPAECATPATTSLELVEAASPTTTPAVVTAGDDGSGHAADPDRARVIRPSPDSSGSNMIQPHLDINRLQLLTLRSGPHSHPGLRRLLRLALDYSAHGDHQAASHLTVRARRTARIELAGTVEQASICRVTAVIYMHAGLLQAAEREIVAAIDLCLAAARVADCMRCRIVAAEIHLAQGQTDQARGQLLAVLDNLTALDAQEVLHVGRLDALIASGPRQHP